MARITIKDLTQNSELDRAAMLAIKGGARASGRSIYAEALVPSEQRLVDYPPGFARERQAQAARGAKRVT